MLRLDDLQVSLDAEAGLVRAVDGLALAIDRGETFALVGESGCGKSMTALALMRLLPDNGRVTRGTLRLGRRFDGAASLHASDGPARFVSGGEPAPAGWAATTAGVPAAEEPADLFDLPESIMRTIRGARIGMIFQEPSTSLNPVMRVGEQIVEAIEAHTALRGKAARERAIEWLGRVGIPEPATRIDEYPFRLSGGQKQRVMIAMALACEPDFLVADEPTTALDVTIQAQILELLQQLQRDHGLGMLLITHDLAVVSGMAHRVALMYAGQIVEVATAEQFFSAPKHPYARLLLAALPGATRRGEPLAAIAGSVPSLATEFVGCRFAPRCDRVFGACHSVAPKLVAADDLQTHEARCLLYTPLAPGADEDSAADRSSAQKPVPRAGPASPDEPSEPGDPHGGGPLENRPAERWRGRPPGSSAPLVPGEAITAGTTRADKTPQAGLDSDDSDDSVGAVGAARPMLDVRHLTVRFPVRRSLLSREPRHFTAVDDVSFTLATGKTLALVGESGCGKTTLGKAIVQLLRRQAVVEGSALLGGVDLFGLNGAALLEARSRIQIIFQDPFASLDPRMRVFDSLEEGLASLQPSSKADERRARIEAQIDRVGLRRDALDLYPHEFSGGQRQRIAIARALVVNPRLIVCDEPTSALDVSVQAQILNLLTELQRDTGVSLLFITHNVGVVEAIADEVAVMSRGKLVEQGSVDQVMHDPQSPFTKALLASVPRLKPRT
ncbi:MAG: ATPase component ABC-type dipeptide/oligopeptide/nickel transport system [Rhizobacter sp.]|nr:ATPase component ABC-type dipeptide/oligopeptide/nickel transport system [Rhizobacter sp.]